MIHNMFMAQTNTYVYGQDNPFCVKGSFDKMEFIFVEYHDVDLDYFQIIENILRCFIVFNWQLHYPLNIMKSFHAVCCNEFFLKACRQIEGKVDCLTIWKSKIKEYFL